jgi:hypothetical protein
MALFDLAGVTGGVGGILSGVNNVNIGDLAGAAATSVAAGWLVNGFQQKLATDLGNVLPHPAQTTSNAPTIPTVPVVTQAQLNAMSPAALSAFFAAGGHVVG